MIQEPAQQTAKVAANDAAQDLTAPCPKCRADMVYVTALPHPYAPEMRRTVFLCASCNQTRNYSLSAAMAEAYAALFAPRSEQAASMREVP
jgi:C4-type Zn-finger protein